MQSQQYERKVKRREIRAHYLATEQELRRFKNNEYKTLPREKGDKRLRELSMELTGYKVDLELLQKDINFAQLDVSLARNAYRELGQILNS